MRFSTWCYPETVYRILVLNTPPGFPVMWKVI